MGGHALDHRSEENMPTRAGALIGKWLASRRPDACGAAQGKTDLQHNALNIAAEVLLQVSFVILGGCEFLDQ